MKNYPDFWSVLLGNGPHGFFFGYLTMGFIAAAAMMCVLVAGRDKESSSTPRQWSWQFFWVNNVLRIVATALLLFLFVRIAYEYVDGIWMIIFSIGLGFGFPKLAHIAKKWGLLTTDRLSDRVTEILNQKEIQKTNQTKP
jgi:hypothetical protein